MFYNSDIKKAPELPATKLAPHCYEYMFYNCYLDTAMPILPATELAPYCYASMFEEVSRLSVAPELPATELVTGCYNRMFYNAAIRVVICHLKNWYAIDNRDDAPTYDWLRVMYDGAGVVYNLGGADIDIRGPHRFPIAWKVISDEDFSLTKDTAYIAYKANPSVFNTSYCNS
jgi:hypothetical protein